MPWKLPTKFPVREISLVISAAIHLVILDSRLAWLLKRAPSASLRAEREMSYRCGRKLALVDAEAGVGEEGDVVGFSLEFPHPRASSSP